MEYKIIMSNTYCGEDFVKIRKRIDLAVDDFWFFVEDSPKQTITIFKNGVDITEEIKNNKELRNKYYKGLGI